MLPSAIVLISGSLILAGCTDSSGPGDSGGASPAVSTYGDGADLGPAVIGEPTGSLPWALSPILAEEDTLYAANALLDVAVEGMWEMSAGVTAFDLGTGEQRWHLDYSDPAFGIDPASLPTEATADVFSNKDGKLAVVYSAITCPGDECTGEEPEDFALVTVDGATGAVISSVTGQGAFPTVVAFVGDVVVYAPDWEHMIAVKVDAVAADPVWSSPTFDVYPDSVIEGAVFTAVPEDVPDALGWVQIADGQPADYTIDLDVYQSFSLVGPGEAFVTWGEGDDHVVEKVDPVTSEVLWQAIVPATEEENETLQVTATRVVLSYDAEESYRTVVLDRETGEESWTNPTASAGQVNDRWALIDSSGVATSWSVVNVDNGEEVSVIDASGDIIPSVELGLDWVLIAQSGQLESRALATEGEGDTANDWSIETPSTDAEITSQLGDLLLIDPQTGATQRVTLPTS
jgi:hypothetical protein